MWHRARSGEPPADIVTQAPIWYDRLLDLQLVKSKDFKARAHYDGSEKK